MFLFDYVYDINGHEMAAFICLDLLSKRYNRGKMSHTLTSLEFLFTNGGNEVHTHTEPSVLASCYVLQG